MNDFNWRHQPSKNGVDLMRGFVKHTKIPIMPILSGSIAGPQKVKQKPGVGINSTS